MYYEIKKILDEHLPPTVGVLDFAHVLDTYVVPELKDYFIEKKTELVSIIRDDMDCQHFSRQILCE